MTTHERCFLCAFWNGDRCTQTWRLTIHIEPIGGQVDFQTAPGMVPEELKPKVTEYFQKFLSKVLPAIEMMPIWDEIREWQLAHLPETSDCPARKVRDDIKPFLHVVRPQ
jgi:hypothetical protein